MVGHRHVVVPQRFGGVHHDIDRVAPVAPIGVHVQIATHVADGQQHRQGTGKRRVDLAVALAQLGSDVGEVESGVDVRLLRKGWQARRVA
jgi:hypothetical protein